MNPAEHYVYRVHWSGEDASYVGTVAELPSLSWLAEKSGAAFTGIRNLAAEVVADMETTGETPPQAIFDRTYSGKFQVRIPPELHRRLAVEASEQNVSLNRLAAARLSGVG